MKISAPLSACGELARVLHLAGVNACLIERTGSGWMVELLAPPSADLLDKIERAGAVVVQL